MVDDVGGFWWFLEPLLPDTHLTSSDHIILNASDFNASLCIALPSIPSVWNAHHQWRKWHKSIRFGLEGNQYQNQNQKKKKLHPQLENRWEQDPSSHARVRLHQCTTAAIAVGVILPKVGTHVLAVLLEAMDPRNLGDPRVVWWRYVALRYMVLLGSVQRKSCVKPQIFKRDGSNTCRGAK